MFSNALEIFSFYFSLLNKVYRELTNHIYLCTLDIIVFYEMSQLFQNWGYASSQV